ncbi:MAG: hypothetical protein IT376_18950 [Polyangiaceae bacterium]|nr:hypothetical protein [Polyangiaceae bacterium]
MTPDEIDVAIEELETRVERLRALYEQYFLGIEKIEPQVARKDVDRRIWVLRREQIRNTGKRFKLQTIIQRYNTFQQYWQRICREIEAGTYIRHLLRAEARVGEAELLTIAARKRLGRKRAAEVDGEAAASARRRAAVEAAEADLAAMATEVEAPTQPAQPGLVARLLGGAGTETPGSPPAPAVRAPSGPARAAPRAAPKTEPRADLGALELDLDLFDAPTEPAARPAVPARGAPAPSGPARGAPAPSGPARGAPAPSAPTPKPLAPRAPAVAPLTTQGATAAAKPVAPRAAPPGAEPPAARPAAPPADPRAAQAAPPRAPGPAAAAAAPRPAPPAPAPAATAGGLAEERVRALHAKLVEVKRTTNEGAAPSMESLARTLRETEKRLREKHGRAVDFDVVLKDGKAAVKPILR